MNKRVEIENPFSALAAINVNEHVEKKAGLSYLSWAWAVDKLMRADPLANWQFHEPQMFGETMMVSCTVTAFGKPLTMHLPVMDHRNKAIPNPNAFDVNKNMMRCLVKAIACHGLGLYIYAGEDLPEGEEPAPKTSAERMAASASANGVTPTAGSAEALTAEERASIEQFAQGIQVHFDAGMPVEKIAEALHEEDYNTEQKVYCWSLLDSKIRSAIKKHQSKPTAADIAAQA